MEKNVPREPAAAAKIKYNVPMSLWLVEYNQRLIIILSDLASQRLGCSKASSTTYWPWGTNTTTTFITLTTQNKTKKAELA